MPFAALRICIFFGMANRLFFFFAQTLAELKRLIAYYEQETGQPQKFFAVGLSSRRKMCINDDV
jgi:hypothetical protein